MNVGAVPVHVAGETLLCVDAGLAATQRNHGILRSAAQRWSAAARTRGRAEVIARDRTGRRALVPAQLKVQTKQPPRGRGRRRHKQKSVALRIDSRV